MPRGSPTTVGAWVLAVLFAGAALARPIERNPPSPPKAPPATLPQPAAPTASNDARSLGPNLAAIVILDAKAEPISPPSATGVQFVGASRLASPASERLLARFLGRPLSRKLISEVEAAIVRRYRDLGYPFVSVSTPAQELTSGVLQVRVIEFRAGRVSVAGTSAGEARDIEHSVRLSPGQPINAPLLLQDLDWLGKYPYRTIQPVFTPGAGLGETDLSLNVTDLRPWRVYAGYANSGSPATGDDRIFVGGDVGNLPWRDSVLSFQLTGSPDFWAKSGDLLPSPHPLYKGAAVRLAAPLGPRQALEISLDGVETNETVQAFLVREQTVEASALYRSAVSNFAPLPGDVDLGLEVRREVRKTFFGDVEVLRGSIDIFQVVAGWRGSWSDPAGHTLIDLSGHVSPGGIDDRNTDAAMANFSSGRAEHAAYAYATLNLTRETRLPRGFAWGAQVLAQYAGQALPETEQMALGGPALVRGYTFDDGAFDDAVIARNELHSPPIRLEAHLLREIVVDPFVFVDAADGRDEGVRKDSTLASAGVGANLAIRTNFAAGLSVAYPFETAKATHAGDWRLLARATITY